MSKTKTTISNGVGQFSVPANIGMSRHDTEEFCHTWCVHGELFQDIKLAISQVYDGKMNRIRQYFRGKKVGFIAQLKVYDAHKVLEIDIHYYQRNRTDSSTHRIDSVFLHINDDGMITDLVTEMPKMNPGNGRPVANKQH